MRCGRGLILLTNWHKGICIMIQTIRRAQVSFPDGIAFVDVTWDSPAPDPEGGWLYEGPLVNIVAANTSAIYTASVRIKRGSGQGQNFINTQMPPGFSQTFLPGGPVRNVDDIPWFSLGADLTT